MPSSSSADGAICAPLPYWREFASAMNSARLIDDVGDERLAFDVERVVNRIAAGLDSRAAR